MDSLAALGQEILGLRTLTTAATDARCVVSRVSHRFLEVNSSMCELLGYSRSELLEMRPADISAESIEFMDRVFERLVTTPGRAEVFRANLRTKEGEQRQARIRCSAHRSDSDWAIVGLVQLLEKAPKIGASSPSLPSGVRSASCHEYWSSMSAEVNCMLQPGIAGVFGANHVLCFLSGYSASELSSLSLDSLLGSRGAWESIEQGGASGIVSTLQCKDGTNALLEWDSKADAAGVVYVVARDITEHRRTADRLTYVSEHDPLTGLDHHLNLISQLAIGLDDKAQCWILFIGIDRFHAVNTLLDYAMGDYVLALLAKRMRGCLDNFGRISRFMGDEFVVLVIGSSRLQVVKVAEQIRVAIAEPIHGHGYQLSLTASVGISHSPEHGSKPRELVRRAEAAMRAVKQHGRDSIREYSSDEMIELEDRLILGSQLQVAIERNELELCYQPLFAVPGHRLSGFEALLRWTSVELGQVSPGRFIPVAEALGLMCEIGSWVLVAACMQARAWLNEGHRGFSLAINVSAQQLQRPDFVEEVEAALRVHTIPSGLLHIELTESSLMGNVVQGQQKLTRLKQLGVSLSIDDFGTGYSSLAYLKHFEIDKLKIDQSFVRGLPRDGADVAIAQAIIAMAHRLGMSVTAEGVETQAQRTFLEDAGCDELQGYLLGAPVTATVATRMLGSHMQSRH